MINRKDLLTSIFNKTNITNIIDLIIPADQPEREKRFEIPELSGEVLYYEAMKLGIDPSSIAPGKLKQLVTAEIIKKQKEQAPSETGAEPAGNSVDG